MQRSRSTEDGLAHVDLNRNVDALYVKKSIQLTSVKSFC